MRGSCPTGRLRQSTLVLLAFAAMVFRPCNQFFRKGEKESEKGRDADGASSLGLGNPSRRQARCLALKGDASRPVDVGRAEAPIPSAPRAGRRM